tara:strand:- start:331 stop:567 length:237 start_codon:yes stop_codon:yes gene_type:complete
MFNSFLNKIGLYNIFNEGDYELIKIRENLKHTVTLRKQFYAPTEQEIMNKYQMIINRKKPKIDVDSLIEAKKNLIHIK